MGRKRNVPPPSTRHVREDPRAQLHSPNQSPRVQAKADVFHRGAAPSQAPPGPPTPLTV